MLRLSIFFFLLAAISGLLQLTELSVCAEGVAKFFMVTFLAISGLCIFLAGRLVRTSP